MGKAKIAGVAFFGRSPDLKAFTWAIEHLKLSNEYKLWIIHVDELNNDKSTDRTARETPGSRYKYNHLAPNIKKRYPNDWVSLEDDIKRCHCETFICGVAYEGTNSGAVLQYAVNKLQDQEDEGLDTLVLAWCAEDDTNKGPQIELESKECSIILVKVDSTQGKLSVPKDGLAGTVATLSSDMASARRNETHSSTLSEENTQHAKPRNTGNAQPSSSGSGGTGIRRPGGSEKKDT